MAQYGAVLLRGFEVDSDEDFEKVVLSIPDFRGMREAFMSENGRTQVGNLQYVLHTNSVYKTGGTLYLGGFHTENYYSADVPSYICFCCLEPSRIGGETGLINTQKLYASLSENLQKKLEKQPFLAAHWSVSEIAGRYQQSPESIRSWCAHFKLPVRGDAGQDFLMMYKPSVFKHPITQEKCLQVNTFEIPKLNEELRIHFMDDYQGNTWFWHRLVWRLPAGIFAAMEHTAVACIAFFNSPKKSFKILANKMQVSKMKRKAKLPKNHWDSVGSCFSTEEIKELAKSMRSLYCSCLWKKGDILLIDNRKVMHAGMPGEGPRLIRAIICNPIEMQYLATQSGVMEVKERTTDTIGLALVSRG